MMVDDEVEAVEEVDSTQTLNNKTEVIEELSEEGGAMTP